MCQHILVFLSCWEIAVSLMAQCPDLYGISSASGGPGRLKHFACDDLGVEVSDQRSLDQMVWWWHLGCQALFTLPNPCSSVMAKCCYMAMLLLLDHSIMQK